MLESLGYVLLNFVIGFLISIPLHLALYNPEKRMKGHAGRGKCKCCTKN